MPESTNGELVCQIRENNRVLLCLLACPPPTADGALLGYEGEIRVLEADGDELLEEADRRKLSRSAALLGVIKKTA